MKIYNNGYCNKLKFYCALNGPEEDYSYYILVEKKPKPYRCAKPPQAGYFFMQIEDKCTQNQILTITLYVDPTEVARNMRARLYWVQYLSTDIFSRFVLQLK